MILLVYVTVNIYFSILNVNETISNNTDLENEIYQKKFPASYFKTYLPVIGMLFFGSESSNCPW